MEAILWGLWVVTILGSTTIALPDETMGPGWSLIRRLSCLEIWHSLLSARVFVYPGYREKCALSVAVSWLKKRRNRDCVARILWSHRIIDHVEKTLPDIGMFVTGLSRILPI